MTKCLKTTIFFELKARFPLGEFFSREQAKSECDWLVMSSVFVTSQSSCFFLCSRDNFGPRKNDNKSRKPSRFKRFFTFLFKKAVQCRQVGYKISHQQTAKILLTT